MYVCTYMSLEPSRTHCRECGELESCLLHDSYNLKVCSSSLCSNTVTSQQVLARTDNLCSNTYVIKMNSFTAYIVDSHNKVLTIHSNYLKLYFKFYIVFCNDCAFGICSIS